MKSVWSPNKREGLRSGNILTLLSCSFTSFVFLCPLCFFSLFQAFPFASLLCPNTGALGKHRQSHLLPLLPFPPSSFPFLLSMCSSLAPIHTLTATPSCCRVSLLEKRVEFLSQDLLSFSLSLVGCLAALRLDRLRQPAPPHLSWLLCVLLIKPLSFLPRAE